MPDKIEVTVSVTFDNGHTRDHGFKVDTRLIDKQILDRLGLNERADPEELRAVADAVPFMPDHAQAAITRGIVAGFVGAHLAELVKSMLRPCSESHDGSEAGEDPVPEEHVPGAWADMPDWLTGIDEPPGPGSGQ